MSAIISQPQWINTTVYGQIGDHYYHCLDFQFGWFKIPIASKFHSIACCFLAIYLNYAGLAHRGKLRDTFQPSGSGIATISLRNFMQFLESDSLMQLAFVPLSLDIIIAVWFTVLIIDWYTWLHHDNIYLEFQFISVEPVPALLLFKETKMRFKTFLSPYQTTFRHSIDTSLSLLKHVSLYSSLRWSSIDTVDTLSCDRKLNGLCGAYGISNCISLEQWI